MKKEKLTIAGILRQAYEYDYSCNLFCDSSYNRKLYTVGVFEKSNLAEIPIADIQKDDINAFLQSLTNYSNSSITKIYTALKEAFELAVDDEIIEDNPLRNKRRFKIPKSNKKDKKVMALTIEEQKRFLEALDELYIRQPHGNYYKNQFLIALHTGMRMGEINGLKPEDIDFENGCVNVRRTVSRGIDYQVVLHDKTKTRAGTRAIPMSSAVKEVFRDAVDKYRINPYGLLFYDFYNDRPIATSIVNSSFRRICEAAGISLRGQHSLRHTFATRNIEAGVPATVLAKWLGHTDISVTLNTYTDVFNSLQKDNMIKYDEYMNRLINIY